MVPSAARPAAPASTCTFTGHHCRRSAAWGRGPVTNPSANPDPSQLGSIRRMPRTGSERWPPSPSSTWPVRWSSTTGPGWAGLSTVLALVLSGVLPFLRVGVTAVRHRRIDAIGVLVLSGIALGTVVGLASGSARLYLLDGIVPTVAIGIVCLASLLSEKPMMYRLAVETMGEDTQRGHTFAEMWSYSEFRRIFKVITVVWGLVFLGESALQAILVETTSINTAKLTSNVLPVVVFVLTFAWTRAYGRHVQHRSGPS